MADKKRTSVRISKATPHRLKKRYATRITATPRTAPLLPRASNRGGSISGEEVESVRDDYWSRPLPTSPAPSPPRPKEICPQFKCTLTGNPDETHVYTYRKIYNENDETLRDALGRATAGRHSIPAREVVRDRSYMTPSTRAKEAHGIAFWPDPPMAAAGDSSARASFVDYAGGSDEKITVATTPPSRDPDRRVHTTARKQVVARRKRLFMEESDGGAEGDDEGEEEGKTLGRRKEESAVKTALMAGGDTAEKASSRKRRASRMPALGPRRRLYSVGSVKSDGLRFLTSSDEEGKGEEQEEGEDEVEDGGEVSEDAEDVSGHPVVVEEGTSEDGGTTIEEEDQGGSEEEEEEGMGAAEIEEGSELTVDGSEEEEEEKMEMEDESETDEEEKSANDSDRTLHEELSDESGEAIGDGSQQNDSFIGDVSLIDSTLPLDDVHRSIVDVDLRRLLAVCKQTNVIGMDEFMVGIEWAVKVGEGGYAEVFLVKRQWETEEKVFKLLPLKEDEDAGKFFGEVIISKELTRLQTGRSSTNAFAKLFRARVIRGLFHPKLSAAWEEFKEKDIEEAMNDDNPEELGDDQLWLCLEIEYGGLNLRKYPFSSVLQLLSVYAQTALALAVAESEFMFEHRDLHEENVLVKPTEEDAVEFTFDRKLTTGDNRTSHKWMRVPCHGVKCTLIDFTLSRMTRKPESRRIISDVDINHEIGEDITDQTSEGEQYQVYKKMKKLTGGHWHRYTPKSNVLWLRMQINWIIRENLNPASDLNKARVQMSKTKQKNPKSAAASRRPSKRATDSRSTGEGEMAVLSGRAWVKKLKEGKQLITKLKKFAKHVGGYASAEELVCAQPFTDLLALLEKE